MRLIAKLPDPFRNESGRVSTLSGWQKQRERIADLLLSTQYGTMPGAPARVTTQVGDWEKDDSGRMRRQDTLTFFPDVNRPDTAFSLDLAITARALPGGDTDRLPALIYVGGKRFDAILDAGLVTINYPNDTLEPMEMGKPRLGPARQAYETLEPVHYTWGSISAWAWGAIRVLEYASTLPFVDPGRIAISGHSRNGKTALLAGALDERFAVVNPAGSGCAGAGSYLALGPDCEDLAALTSRLRWWAWTHPDFESWAGREAELPFDQHFLMSLVAPRPLLRTEGLEDHWANPIGTSAAWRGTQAIYDALSVPTRNAIFYREGGHDHTEQDAAILAAVCEEAFFGRPLRPSLNQGHPDLPADEDLLDWGKPW